MDNEYKILKYDVVQEILSSKQIEFVALEKIHGTNFSFITDGVDVQCCRRSDILKLDENFFSYQNILLVYKNKILKLFNQVQKIIKKNYNQDIWQIQLYGELYGGNYPGIERAKGSQTVQKGIYYSNSNEFAAFDLRYWITNSSNEQKESKYLDWDLLVNLLNLVSIPTVPIISQGNWEIISKLDPKFESEVYKVHNLPKIDSNFAEGYVIKPTKEIRFGKDEDRLIWKFKNPSFSEISNNKKKTIISNDDKNNIYILRLEQYINENRYDNVVSKIIEGTPVEKLVELFQQDIWVDFIDDLNSDKIELELEDKKELERKLKGYSNKFVRTRYSKIKT